MATIYQYATDNVAPNATVVGTTADSNYPAANLVDTRFDQPAKVTGTTGNWVLDFGSAQRVDLVAFGPHNLTPGLAGVKIQGNASNSWGGPTLSADFVIPAKREDGHSVNPFLDLTGVSGYSTGGFRYWRLVVTNANAVAVAIGELWMGATKRTLAKSLLYGLSRGFTESETNPDITTALEGGDLRVYTLGTYIRQIQGQLVASDTVLTSVVRPWYRASKGRYGKFLFVLDSSINDALFVRFNNQPFSIDRRATNVNYVEINLLQDAMGRTLY